MPDMQPVREVMMTARVRDIQLAEHLDKTRRAHLASLFASMLAIVVFREFVQPGWLIYAWFALLNGISLVRLWLHEHWKCAPTRFINSHRWELLFAFLAGASGLAWALLCTVLLPDEASGMRPVAALCLMGVAAGGVLSLSCLISAYYAFYLCMLVPGALYLAVQEAGPLRWISLILLVFICTLLINGRRAAREVTQLIVTRLELAAAVEEAQAARNNAEEANHAKSQFLANVSHELRTPIHAILGFSQLGGERSQDRKLIEYCNRIYASGVRLLALINDLLDLSKLEAGRMDMSFYRQSLLPIVDAAIHEAEPLVRERTLRIVVDVPETLPPLVCDGLRIGQVVRNLLSNAVKFSPVASQIRIALSLIEEAGMLRLSLLDQGPGIPPDELEAIFDEFVQSSKTITGAGGTGLGLAICRRIVLAHHGRIYASNHPQGGAELTVELPLKQPETAKLV